LAQQAGVEQCLESHPPQQQQLDFAPPTPMPPETVGTLCQARIITSGMTAAVFTKRDIMVSSWSLSNAPTRFIDASK
jgi:hypothetical protein